MTRRRLEAITIEGFTSLRSSTVELRDLNVLVGANGAGKSNFVSALAMLGRIVDGELNLFVGTAGGAGVLLHNGAKGSTRISLRLDFAPNGYEADLVPSVGDELIFGRETVLFQGEGYEQPFVLSLGAGHRETRLTEEVKQQRAIAGHVTRVLHGCRVFHFHDTSANAPVKQSGYAADNLTLHPDARNLAAVLLRLRNSSSPVYQRIVRDVQKVAPFFRDFVLVEQHERLQLRWKQEGSDTVFPANALSDGTLRFVCLATLLNLPDLPGLVVLDEPELGLHPYAIVQLADMLRAASQDSQVVVATQSVTLMDQFALDDLIVVERQDGASTFGRPNPERLQDWLDEYSLGELWQKNLLGGRPIPEGG
ncbi:AAA family ATPase [Nocardiopsis ansamitocini]|uniref:Chromosome segregation protein SMC n=1 Tax=Nocardiopsis ansamitocini TaxID=1670832 RepID=A0A9W6P6K8_9ACTN|nr:AAA family ATPase [Nocardiopsis ansamitocini]GLU47977.1 chromosome segregation protein SMC [Nocardiopsis ansamitocini]